jgi:hypothetical protein
MSTCQICAREIKTTKRNELYSHGYKVPMYGYRSSECEGTSYVPYEVSNARLGEIIIRRREYIEKLKETIAHYDVFPPDEIKAEDFRGKTVTYTRPEDFNPRIKAKTFTRNYQNEYEIQKIRYRGELRMSEASLAWMQHRYENWHKQDPEQMSIVGFVISGIVRCNSCLVGLQHDEKMLEAVKTGIIPVELTSNKGIPILPVLAGQGASLVCVRCECQLAPIETFNEESQIDMGTIESEMQWLDIQAEIEGAF